MVICLELSADLHIAQWIPLPLTVSCFSKIQIGFSFLLPAHVGSPGQRAVKRVHVCVMWYAFLYTNDSWSCIFQFCRCCDGLPRVSKETAKYCLIYPHLSVDSAVCPFTRSSFPFPLFFFPTLPQLALFVIFSPLSFHLPVPFCLFLIHLLFLTPALCDIERFACWKALRSHIFFF